MMSRGRPLPGALILSLTILSLSGCIHPEDAAAGDSAAQVSDLAARHWRDVVTLSDSSNDGNRVIPQAYRDQRTIYVAVDDPERGDLVLATLEGSDLNVERFAEGEGGSFPHFTTWSGQRYLAFRDGQNRVRLFTSGTDAAWAELPLPGPVVGAFQGLLGFRASEEEFLLVYVMLVDVPSMHLVRLTHHARSGATATPQHLAFPASFGEWGDVALHGGRIGVLVTEGPFDLVLHEGAWEGPWTRTTFQDRPEPVQQNFKAPRLTYDAEGNAWTVWPRLEGVGGVGGSSRQVLHMAHGPDFEVAVYDGERAFSAHPQPSGDGILFVHGRYNLFHWDGASPPELRFASPCELRPVTNTTVTEGLLHHQARQGDTTWHTITHVADLFHPAAVDGCVSERAASDDGLRPAPDRDAIPPRLAQP